MRFKGELTVPAVTWMPSPSYGRKLLASLDSFESLREYAVVFSTQEAWERQKISFPDTVTVFHVTDMSVEGIRQRTVSIGESQVSCVFGIGEASDCDHAKFAAWMLSKPLILLPTSLSADASYRRAARVRENGPCRLGSCTNCIGDARPEKLLIDFDVLQAAPVALNRAGIGNLISCFTALWDWQTAHERQGERYDASVAARTKNAILDELISGSSAKQIRETTDAGLKLISDLYVRKTELCEAWGNSRPEEGSEHHIACALQRQTSKSYIHGQLLGLCTVIAAHFQGQDVGHIAKFVRTAHLDCSYDAVGTSRAEMRDVLTSMEQFLSSPEQEHLLPGVFHFKGSVPENQVDEVLDFAEAVLGMKSAPIKNPVY